MRRISSVLIFMVGGAFLSGCLEPFQCPLITITQVESMKKETERNFHEVDWEISLDRPLIVPRNYDLKIYISKKVHSVGGHRDIYKINSLKVSEVIYDVIEWDQDEFGYLMIYLSDIQPEEFKSITYLFYIKSGELSYDPVIYHIE